MRKKIIENGNKNETEKMLERVIIFSTIINLQLTVWGNKKEKLESQHGNISYLDWCVHEADRINSQVGRMAEVREKTGRVAVFCNWVAAQKNTNLEVYKNEIYNSRKIYPIDKRGGDHLNALT